MMGAILAQETAVWDRDGSAMCYPWRAAVADHNPARKLRIGYYVEDPSFPTHPPVRRALDESAKALAAAGHEIIVLKDTPSVKTAADLAASYWSMDNSKVWLKNIESSGEPIIPSLQKTLHLVLKKPEGYTLEELFEVNTLVAAYRPLWNDIWVQNKLDIIMAPSAQTTALPHDCFGVVHYTMVWNLLQWPGLIVPLGKADKEIDREELAKPDPESGRVCESCLEYSMPCAGMLR